VPHSPIASETRLRAASLILSIAAFGSRPQEKQQFCKKRAGLTGAKVYRGAHFDEDKPSVCLAHDRLQHRSCSHLIHCGKVRASPSPRGIVKREEDRARARELKKALDPDADQPDDPADDTKWHEITSQIFWMGKAVDGRGHHDGMCEYFVDVPIEDFEDKFFAGGEACWTKVNGGYPEKKYRLPAVRPAAGVFGGLEARAAAM